MNILILGGTIFLGRHVVEAALNSGHEVTLFNRGQHVCDLYPQVEQLRGDRYGDLRALEDRQWDAVIDTSGYVPSVVRASASLLASKIKQYVFISSISVYNDVSVMGIDEDAPVAMIAPERLHEAESVVPSKTDATPRVYLEEYGALKALCEQAAEEVMPGRVLHIRPGLIVGPHDSTDRFTYWPRRIARGGEVLAPGRPARHVQLIDARDLSEWIIRLIEAGHVGTYNATSPAQLLTMQDVLETCKTVTGSDATFVWMDEAFLFSEQVEPWVQMPLWVPEDPTLAGFNAISIAKAQAAGLTFRPIATTVRDTLTWDATRPADVVHKAGLMTEDEARLLQRWHQREHA